MVYSMKISSKHSKNVICLYDCLTCEWVSTYHTQYILERTYFLPKHSLNKINPLSYSSHITHFIEPDVPSFCLWDWNVELEDQRIIEFAGVGIEGPKGNLIALFQGWLEGIAGMLDRDVISCLVRTWQVRCGSAVDSLWHLSIRVNVEEISLTMPFVIF